MATEVAEEAGQEEGAEDPSAGVADELPEQAEGDEVGRVRGLAEEEDEADLDGPEAGGGDGDGAEDGDEGEEDEDQGGRDLETGGGEGEQDDAVEDGLEQGLGEEDEEPVPERCLVERRPQAQPVGQALDEIGAAFFPEEEGGGKGEPGEDEELEGAAGEGGLEDEAGTVFREDEEEGGSEPRTSVSSGDSVGRLAMQAFRFFRRKYPRARIVAISLRRSSGDISTGFPLFGIGSPPRRF